MTRSRLFLLAEPGRGEALLQTLDRLELDLALSRRPGFLGGEIEVALDDDCSVTVTGEWASPEHYELWAQSAEHARLLDELDTFLAARPDARVYRVVDAVGLGGGR